MAKFYSYKDIEKPILQGCFIQVNNNNGSHQVYRQEQTDLIVTIPKHPSGVSIGVGQKVLDMVVLGARLMHINIGAKSNKFDTNISDYILDHHKKCKENVMFLIPEEIRMTQKMECPADVKKYLAKQEKQYKQLNESKCEKTHYYN